MPSVVRDLREDPFGLSRDAAPPAGRRTELPHVFIEVREPRLDPCSRRSSRAPSRPHALPRLLQVDVSTSTTTDHPRHPNPLESGWGGCHRRTKVAFRPGQPPKLHKDRGREHRTSALPIGIAPAGDFAPTSLASGTSCRENHPFPCPERRGKRGAPPAQHALASARGDRVVRRAASAKRGDAHQPEGPFILRLLASEQVSRSTDSQSWTATTQRLFHHRET